MGRTVTYEVDDSGANTQRNTQTAPDGSQSFAYFEFDAGASSTTSATGMTSALVEAADPRFGMQAPFVTSAEFSAPEGPTLNVASDLEATLSQVSDPLSLVSLSRSSTVNGRTTTSTYTAADKTTVLTSPEGRVMTIEIDDFGRVVSSQFGDLEPVTASYNGLGQLETLTSGDGDAARVISFSYGPDGLRDRITDPLGRAVDFERDLAGRITTKTLPGDIDILIGYNASGEQDSFTPPGRPEYRFTYTLHGQIESIVPPEVEGSGPITFDYNDDRQLLSVSFPGDEEVLYQYDPQGRVQTIELTEGGLTTATHTMSYLVSDQLDTISGPGAQTLSYSYQGDLVVGESWGGVVEGSIAWTYDSAFRMASEMVTGGTTINFSYDDDDLLLSAGDFSITRSAGTGLPQTTSLGLVDDAWTYNGFGEVTSNAVTANAVEVYGVNYSYDDLGRMTQKVETIGGVTDTYDYEYDLRGQLFEVQKNSVVVESYSYDDNGNRISATVNGTPSAATYDDQDRLLSYGGTSYSYRPAGQLATRSEPGDIVTSYDYDTVGSLRGVTLADATEITYGLDGLGRRVQRAVDGTITQRWLYDGILPLAQLDDQGNVVSQFVYIGGNVPVYMVKGGVSYRLVSDPVGSVRLVIDSTNGNIVQRIDYDSFGNVLGDTHPGFQPFGFAGGLHDDSTGLVRFGSRDYQPRTGRWTAQDSIDYAGAQLNRYVYVRSDPINWHDPAGQLRIDADTFPLGKDEQKLLRRLRQALRNMTGNRGRGDVFNLAPRKLRKWNSRERRDYLDPKWRKIWRDSTLVYDEDCRAAHTVKRDDGTDETHIGPLFLNSRFKRNDLEKVILHEFLHSALDQRYQSNIKGVEHGFIDQVIEKHYKGPPNPVNP
jgi:RHS repeat-associated protein